MTDMYQSFGSSGELHDELVGDLHTRNSPKFRRKLHIALLVSAVVLSLFPIVNYLIDRPLLGHESDETTASQYLYGIYFALYSVYACGLTWGAWKRRAYFPLKPRLFSLLLVTAGLCMSFVLWVAWSHALNVRFPCVLAKIILNIGQPGLALAYILRAWRLGVLFDRSSATLESAEYLAEPSVSHTSFANLPSDTHANDDFHAMSCTQRVFLCCHQCQSRFVSQTRIFVLFCLLLIPFACVTVILILSSNDERYDSFQCTDAKFSQKSRVTWAVVDGVGCFFMSIVIFRLRYVWDGFSLRTELIIAFLIQALFAIVHVCTAAVDSLANESDPTRYLICFRSVLLMYISFGWPLIKSFDPVGSMPIVPNDPLLFQGDETAVSDVDFERISRMQRHEVKRSAVVDVPSHDTKREYQPPNHTNTSQESGVTPLEMIMAMSSKTHVLTPHLPLADSSVDVSLPGKREKVKKISLRLVMESPNYVKVFEAFMLGDESSFQPYVKSLSADESKQSASEVACLDAIDVFYCKNVFLLYMRLVMFGALEPEEKHDELVDIFNTFLVGGGMQFAMNNGSNVVTFLEFVDPYVSKQEDLKTFVDNVAKTYISIIAYRRERDKHEKMCALQIEGFDPDPVLVPEVDIGIFTYLQALLMRIMRRKYYPVFQRTDTFKKLRVQVLSDSVVRRRLEHFVGI